MWRRAFKQCAHDPGDDKIRAPNPHSTKFSYILDILFYFSVSNAIKHFLGCTTLISGVHPLGLQDTTNKTPWNIEISLTPDIDQCACRKEPTE